jgi:hypothetical protein
MRRIGRSLAMFGVSLSALACSAPAGEPPSAPRAAAAKAPTAASAASATAATPPDETVPIPPDRLRPLRQSSLLADLGKVGLTPGALPRLEELSASQRLSVMDTFTKALGVKCVGCHVSDKDYAADTEHKRLTRHMWNDFTRPLKLDGTQLFCDSCHQGSPEILHRADEGSVSSFMKQEFTGRLSTSSGALSCENCHGSPFEPHVFEKLWGVTG